ncbi:MAG: aminotransferase class V-fold PLP-dependent enzyme, partial [Bacillota bacterium]|nr:aminotransferase class V-fold PLP-dependent enzyme [Bacillota bacterium]
VVPCSPAGELSPEAVAASLRPNTRLVVLSHASNVTGTILPVEEVASTLRLRERGVLLLVDAAQSVGELPLNLQRTPIDLLAFPGHKGLLGPPGTGGLFIREGLRLKPLKEGGTGSESELPQQPEAIPDRYESGTLNSVGIAALGEGVAFLQERGLENVRRHQLALQRRLQEGLRRIEGLELYGPEEPEKRVGILALNVRHLSPAEVAFILDQAYGIAVRAGLHCAPWAHRTLGTFPRGAVRISTGCFTTEEEIDALVKALAEIAHAAG